VFEITTAASTVHLPTPNTYLKINTKDGTVEILDDFALTASDQSSWLMGIRGTCRRQFHLLHALLCPSSDHEIKQF
jgi:hypothetical protein